MGNAKFYWKGGLLILVGALALDTPAAAGPALAEVSQSHNVVLSSTRVAKSGAEKKSSVSRRVQLSHKGESLSQPFRGWAYLAEKLRQDGISESQIRAVYSDPRMPRFSFIPFKLRPREPHSMYKNFRSEDKLKVGREFLGRNARTFGQAEKIFGVNRHVVAAIILIESHAGRVFGRELVINRLSRLASIAEPTNILLNYRQLSAEDPDVTFDAVKQRAEYLEDTFYPEVRALFKLRRERQVDLFTLRGSSAGAFGMPQFLPTSFLRFGVDGNRDGTVSLFQEADAIWSTANFLSHFGWRDGANIDHKRRVLWKYNRSEAYVDTALDVAEQLQ